MPLPSLARSCSLCAFALLPNGDIKGSVHANSSMGGQSVTMDMTYAGEHTASCDYTASRQKR